MKDYQLTDHHAKELIFDAFATGRSIMPVSQFRDVAGLYFQSEPQRERFPDRTLWSLNNAFTESAKGLKNPDAQARAEVSIGRYFAWVASLATGESVAIPALPAPASDPTWEVLGPEGDPLD
jgi:hypothetical protein